eukprot:s622_g12.t2
MVYFQYPNRICHGIAPPATSLRPCASRPCAPRFEERFLQVESPVLTQASKDFMALGEAQLDRCAVGRNVTIFEQMLSLWPFWGLLRRVEADGLVQLPSERLRVPPRYVSPTLRPVAALHHPAGARQLHVPSHHSATSAGPGQVCFLASGEKLTVLDQDAVDGKNAKAVKQILSAKVGATRFRQRLYLEGGSAIPDDEVFAPGPLKVYLVVLNFLPLDAEEYDQIKPLCRNNDWLALEELLQKPLNPDVADKIGSKPLHHAAHQGHVESIRLLLEAGADLEAPDNLGMTPFCVAAWQGHIQCVYFLFEAGANKDQPTPEDEMSPLHYAAANNHLEIVRFLVEAGSNKDQPELDGTTPMHLAANEGHLDMIRLLVQLGASTDVQISDEYEDHGWNGFTPMHIAVEQERLEIVGFLIEAGANFDQPTPEHGITPLHIAAEDGLIESVRLLVNAGADLYRVSESIEHAAPRSCEARGVHVALSGDGRHMEGLLAVIQSLILGTKFAERVCVHVFALQIELTGLLAAFRCSFQTRLQKGPGENNFLIDGVAVVVHIFREAEVITADLVVDEGVTAETGDLNAPHNFVRFYLGRWIRAERIIYLDTDVIVKGDVCELHDLAFSSRSEAVVAAVPRRHLPLSFYLKVFSPKMPIWVPSSAPSFNAGVMVIDMKRWEQLKVTEQVLLWASQNGPGRDLWRHGSQPPLLLLLYDRVEWIPDVWNVDGLGHGRGRSEDAIQDAKILHWTGPLKPWLSNGLRKDLWEPFKVHCWDRTLEDLQRSVVVMYL